MENKAKSSGSKHQALPNPPPRNSSGVIPTAPFLKEGIPIQQPAPRVLTYQDLEREMVLTQSLADKNRLVLQLMAELEVLRNENFSLSTRITALESENFSLLEKTKNG